jgi:RNA polymerase sigma factor (sigma-70 family)
MPDVDDHLELVERVAASFGKTRKSGCVDVSDLKWVGNHTLLTSSTGAHLGDECSLSRAKLIIWRAMNRHVQASKRRAEVPLTDQILSDSRLAHADFLEQRILHEAVLELSNQARTVLAAIYQDGLSQREVAHLLGVAESRVSQIHSKALKTLRCRLKP